MPPRTKAAEAESTGGAPPLATWRSALLGLNLWVVLDLWPTLHTPADGWLGALALPLPLAVLTCGVYLSHLPRCAERWTLAVWLVAFPASVCAGLAVHSEAALQAALEPPLLALGSLLLVAYGWSASQGKPVEASPSTTFQITPLPADAGPAPPSPPLARRAVTICAALAVLGLTVVAPSLGGFARLQDTWGEAAAEGGVFTAVVGGALAVCTLTLFVGPALRGGRTPPPALGRAGRVVWRLSMALIGALTYKLILGD